MVYLVHRDGLLDGKVHHRDQDNEGVEAVVVVFEVVAGVEGYELEHHFSKEDPGQNVID